jgi:hypothetical protein
MITWLLMACLPVTAVDDLLRDRLVGQRREGREIPHAEVGQVFDVGRRHRIGLAHEGAHLYNLGQR